jgi:hypothetical protein
MGHWNGTCGITNLPIRSGDPVAAFLIAVPISNLFADKESAPAGDYSGFSYIGEVMTLPFFGKYNDYGGIEDVEESFATKDVMRHFNRPENESFEDFVNDRVERDELVLDQGWRKVGVGLWMVHKRVFDDLSKIDMKTWNGKTSSEFFYEDMKKVRDGEYDGDFTQLRFDGCFWLSSGGGRDGLIHSNQALFENQNDFLRMRLFCLSMSSLRKAFVPVGGKGEQSSCFGHFKLLAELTLELMEGFRNEDLALDDYCRRCDDAENDGDCPDPDGHSRETFYDLSDW